MHEKVEQMGVAAKITGGLEPPTRLVPKESKRGAMNALSPKLLDLPSRALSHIDHLNRELNRKTKAGTSIPDDATVFSTGDFVRVKGELFRIKSLDAKRLVLESAKEPLRGLATLKRISFVTSMTGQMTDVHLGVFVRGDEPDAMETDRYDVDQRLTVEGREYVVTGKALILAPMPPPLPEADEKPQATAPGAPEDHSTAEPSTSQ